MAMLGSGIDFTGMAINAMNQQSKAVMDEAQQVRLMQQKAQMDSAAEAGKQAIAQIKAQQEEAKSIESGKQKTRQLLQRGITDVERQAEREAANISGGGKLDQYGNFFGVDADQNDMHSYIKPIARARKYLSRAEVMPEYIDVAKSDISRSYGITDPKKINKRLNLFKVLPESEIVYNTELLRKGTGQKWAEKLGLKGEQAKEALNKEIEKRWAESEKKYNVSDLDPKITGIKIETITPELMNEILAPEEGATDE